MKVTKAQVGKRIAQIAKDNKLGIPYADLSNWRKGACLPTLERFLTICAQAKHVDVNEFVALYKNSN